MEKRNFPRDIRLNFMCLEDCFLGLLKFREDFFCVTFFRVKINTNKLPKDTFLLGHHHFYHWNYYYHWYHSQHLYVISLKMHAPNYVSNPCRFLFFESYGPKKPSFFIFVDLVVSFNNWLLPNYNHFILTFFFLFH